MPASPNVPTPDDAVSEGDDLRGAITAAIETTAANDVAPEPALKVVPKSSAPADTSVQPPPADEATPQAPAQAGAETTETEQPAAETVPADGKVEPPSNWSKADKERFAEWPEPAQKQFLERFKAQEADYTRKTMEVAELKREYAPVDEMFAPYKQQLRQQGRTPSSIIRDWANAEAALSNPNTRENAILGIARGYGVDLAKLAGAQQSQPHAQAFADPANMSEKEQLDALLNPYIKQALTPYEQQVRLLQEQLVQAQQFQNNSVQQQRQQVLHSVVNEVEAFANAKDSQGTPLHPYFRDVENDMAAMMAGYANMGRPVPNMEDLYQQAVRANPSTYERLTAQQKNAADMARTQEARAKSVQARRAGSSVNGGPTTGQPFAHASGEPDMSRRDSLMAAYQAAQGAL